ncbi:MAG: hypothetical protein E7425_00895 [Ruminococcaceae bacterium]|nr:hypothetical protein [Oscillospiraceae bacterium]
MMKKLLSRVRSTRGESMVESMFAMVIISLAGLLLAGAIVTTAKLNKNMSDSDKVALFPQYAASSGTEVQVSISGNCLRKPAENIYEQGRTDSGTITLDDSVDIKTDQGGLKYYEKHT